MTDSEGACSKSFSTGKGVKDGCPEGYAAEANRSNNADVGNHASRAIPGDQIYSRDATAQRTEILCVCIAHNLTRLGYVEVEPGIEASFEAGVQVLSRLP